MQINPRQPNFPPNNKRPQNMDLGSELEDEKPEIVLNRMTCRNWNQGIKVDVGDFEGCPQPKEFSD